MYALCTYEYISFECYVSETEGELNYTALKSKNTYL